jgi:hypothetical protein
LAVAAIDARTFCFAAELKRRVSQDLDQNRPFSHSKSMEFNGQRHGTVFRLRWSPQAAGGDDLIGTRG